MRVIKTKTYEEMSLIASDFIGAQILLKPDSVLGLPTGATPIGIYNILVARYVQKRLDFSRVRTLNLDEYVGLSAEHKHSYARFMREQFFNKININPANTHLLNGAAVDIERECSTYDALIHQLGGIDLQMLGVGHNGHIGFNEPADAFFCGTHKIELAKSTQLANSRFFNSFDEVPTFALTMGMRDIMQAKRIILIASGEEKARTVMQMLTGPIVPQMPASILQIHPNCTLIADESVLSEYPS